MYHSKAIKLIKDHVEKGHPEEFALVRAAARKKACGEELEGDEQMTAPAPAVGTKRALQANVNQFFKSSVKKAAAAPVRQLLRYFW
mmetsp:Transcript_37868/g.95730  ORF Transcript_37868/g.95730 Transcript_37868/m.95730 type:complete len:86 (+) Transcript_37868:2637-2894(+)